jgi:hypothetical protein
MFTNVKVGVAEGTEAIAEVTLEVRRHRVTVENYAVFQNFVVSDKLLCDLLLLTRGLLRLSHPVDGFEVLYLLGCHAK